MRNGLSEYPDALLPLAACADPIFLACMLDRSADLMLAYGRTAYAEHLARRAEAMRDQRGAV